MSLCPLFFDLSSRLLTAFALRRMRQFYFNLDSQLRL